MMILLKQKSYFAKSLVQKNSAIEGKAVFEKFREEQLLEQEAIKLKEQFLKQTSF